MTFSAFTTVAGNGKAGYSVDGFTPCVGPPACVHSEDLTLTTQHGPGPTSVR